MNPEERGMLSGAVLLLGFAIYFFGYWRGINAMYRGAREMFEKLRDAKNAEVPRPPTPASGPEGPERR